MSHEITQNFLRTLSFEQRNFLTGFINLNRRDLVLNWDLDQTLGITEDPVKAAFDAKYQTNYFPRRIDGWNTITRWLTADGFDEKKALEDEKIFWRNNTILAQVKPNEPLRNLSYAAFLRKIPQFITTVRSPGLRIVTYKWVEQYFPWIPASNVNFKIGMNIGGNKFKIDTILDLYAKYPDLISVDDDLTIIKPLAEAAPGIGLIGIKYQSDDIEKLNHSPNRVFVERDTLNSMIYYGPPENDLNYAWERMSHNLDSYTHSL